ncbi:MULTISPECIES: glycosyltransferase family 4 protein [Haloferacaceae]|uniref:Glycosyltransferase family 4 protein n=1 Tax=Halorubrum glutamatedens TaxID=2707018 RepID=A0ABD5QQ96_9EURY|nr:glycosyltransferase family 4 protein [Halobellus captivus]
MIRVAALLGVLRHTTIAYEISEHIGQFPNIEMTVISYNDSLIDDLEIEIDTDVVTVKTLNASNRLDLRAISELHDLLRNESFDLLHTHHNFVGSLGCMVAPSDLPIIDTEHANHKDHYSVAQNLVNSVTLGRANRVVANSQATLDSLYPHERVLVPSNQRCVIYNGVDVDWIDTSTKDKTWRTDSPRVTTVGRLIPVKNQETLINSFSAVLDKVPDAELVIVGSGPRQSALEKIAESNGIQDSITLTGGVSREEVYNILYYSDVFALSSYSEGFCVALLEAMASGCPPVVSNIPVLHEVAGDTAVFVDPEDTEGFSAEITRLLDDEDRYQRYSIETRERARTVFSIKRTAEEYLDLYQEVAEGS